MRSGWSPPAPVDRQHREINSQLPWTSSRARAAIKPAFGGSYRSDDLSAAAACEPRPYRAFCASGRGDIYVLGMTLDPDAIAGAFVDFARGSSTALFDLIADDCIDHVSGRTGKDIWATVSDWLQESFADIEVELHAVGTADHDTRDDLDHYPRDAHR